MGVVIVKNKPAVATAKPAVATVSKEMPDGSSKQEQEVVAWSDPIPNPASVNISMGMTKPLKPYENIKFHVSLTVPCASGEPAIEEAYAFAKEWVEGKVNEIHAEITEMME